MKQNTSVINVFMHTTGKILEGNPNYTIIRRSNAATGDLKNILATTEMDAKMNTDAIILMDGKNWNTILKIISSISARTERTVLSLTVPIFILSRIKGSLCKLGSVSSQKPAP